MSQQGVDFLRQAAMAEEVDPYVVCDPHPSVVERLEVPEGEAVICVNGLLTGVSERAAMSAPNRVLRAAMTAAENAGYELINPEWYKDMIAPASVKGIRMSSVGLNPIDYGWSSSYRYPKNSFVQGRAATGIAAYMGTRNPEDLFEVEDSLLADGGKSWSWEMSVPIAVYEGVRASKYLRDHPNDLKGALHTTARALFQPWNR